MVLRKKRYVRRERKGKKTMTEFILSIKESLQSAYPSFSIAPTTDYRRHVPKNAEQLMRNNWNKTGDSLRRAIKKVGEEIDKK